MTELEAAKHWRTELMKLTRAELAPLVGFSAQAIYQIESGRQTDVSALKRYKNACLAVQLMKEQNVVIEQWKWGQE